MKFLFLFALIACISAAHASDEWIITKCSNSDGTVKWEAGDDDEKNQIDLHYSNFVEGTLSLDVSKVQIEFSKSLVLRERSFRNCPYEGKIRVFAANVKIMGSEKFPNILRSQFPENKVLTVVICTSIESKNSDCSEI